MKIKEVFSKWLFPPRCIFCRKFIADGGVCDECKATLPYITPRRSKEKIEFVDENFSVFHYEGNVKNALLRYKFGGLEGYSVYFSEYLADCMLEELKGEYDIISWIPLSRMRLRQRGYDQARLLAEETCKRIGEEPQRTLIKSRNTKPQSRQQTASKRKANILGAYELSSADVVGKRIVLFDDILTTGSTVSECARILKTAGAEKVFILTVAKTRSRKGLKNK